MWPQLRLLVSPPWPWCTCPSVTLKLQQIVLASLYLRLVAKMSQTVTATGIESVVKADEMNVCEGVLCKTSARQILPPSSLNFGLVQLGADFSLAGTFSFFFSRWLQSFEGDRITWERNRITWIGHAKDAAQTFELCVEFKLLRHRKCFHLQFNQYDRNILPSLLEGTLRKVSFKLSLPGDAMTREKALR